MLIRDVTDRKNMEAALHNMNTTLEDRVAERTFQLAETNRKLQETRAEAERANKAKSIFLASMSHEIRTPMNAVLGYTQLLRRTEPLSDVQREYLGTILRSGDHLLDLINQVLELSKIEAGRIVLTPVDFDLHQLLADMKSLFRIQANEKGLSLEVRHEGPVPRHINADSGKIRQVLINVVGNAMKFTQKGGIAITVHDSGPTYLGDDHLIVIEVKDTGPGMKAEDVALIFDHYEQTAAGIKNGAGTGLGLAISKQYAALMEGTLTATSSVGEGTTIAFSFRATAAHEVLPVVDDTKRYRPILKHLPPGLIYKVLIVDDNASNRDILRILLSEKGFITHEAVNGREALAVFWKWKPDLIFMDLRMPEMDGVETIRQIRSTPEGASVPIIVITASALEETEREVLALGANGFIRKPFRDDELCANLMRVLNIVCDEKEEEIPVPAAGTVAVVAANQAAPTVPAALREELHAATLRGDADALRAIADRLPAADASLAAFLHTAIDAFDYEAIMNLLEGEGHE
jgi:signal transduction histidine kinase/CheY-like chemotaxis protein